MSNEEVTLSIIRPHAVASGAVAAIRNIIVGAGLKIIALSRRELSLEDINQLYIAHQGKDFFPALENVMSEGESVLLVIRGENSVTRMRALIGESSDPQKCNPTSIRNLFGQDSNHNAIHGSDSTESARREISLLFQNLKLDLVHPLTP